ncbi:hypothetical protein [Silvimonas iriomotensis]|uniref:hypothetical protein n=1 Tax=Silvimonas iriomotensis TaxID=449662 RepID=UPI001E55BB26|nr:hypothetical protein [Silvimonas iriomotensis]
MQHPASGRARKSQTGLPGLLGQIGLHGPQKTNRTTKQQAAVRRAAGPTGTYEGRSIGSILRFRFQPDHRACIAQGDCADDGLVSSVVAQARFFLPEKQYFISMPLRLIDKK